MYSKAKFFINKTWVKGKPRSQRDFVDVSLPTRFPRFKGSLEVNFQRLWQPIEWWEHLLNADLSNLLLLRLCFPCFVGLRREGRPDCSVSSTVSHPFLNSEPPKNLGLWQSVVFVSLLNQGKRLGSAFVLCMILTQSINQSTVGLVTKETLLLPLGLLVAPSQWPKVTEVSQTDLP